MKTRSIRQPAAKNRALHQMVALARILQKLLKLVLQTFMYNMRSVFYTYIFTVTYARMYIYTRYEDECSKMYIVHSFLSFFLIIREERERRKNGEQGVKKDDPVGSEYVTKCIVIIRVHECDQDKFA